MMPCLGLPGQPQCDEFAPTGHARCPRHEAAYAARRQQTAPPKLPARMRGIDAEYWRNRRIVMRYATRCAICGGLPTDDDPLECGHKIPRAKGGTNELSNLQPEHRSCNHEKGAK